MALPRHRRCAVDAYRSVRESLSDNDRFMLNDLLEEHEALEARITSYTEKIDGQMTPWEEQLRLLTTIPGMDRIAASTI